MAYTIFIVDDDKAFCEEFSDAFYEYNVVKAFTSTEAFDILSKPNEIDLILLDERLPNNKKGTVILNNIKKQNPDIPVIILTGNSNKDVAVRALKAHADDFIEKPMNIEKVKSAVERLLSECRRKKSLDGSDIKSKIQRVKLFIEKNADKIVTLESAAGKVGLSPKYLSRAFKKETGTKFNQYYLSFKFKKAEELLKNTGYTIDQIADKLGYQNPESFIRIYKKYHGTTPTRVRHKDPKSRTTRQNSRPRKTRPRSR